MNRFTKIIILWLLSLFSFWQFFQADAILVRVSTYIPWAWCWNLDSKWDTCTEWAADCFLRCNIEPWFQSINGLFGRLIAYVTYLTWLVGVLWIIIAGIRYSMSGATWDNEDAKKHIKQIFFWLLLLFSSGYILYIIAPWKYSLWG